MDAEKKQEQGLSNMHGFDGNIRSPMIKDIVNLDFKMTNLEERREKRVRAVDHNYKFAKMND